MPTRTAEQLRQAEKAAYDAYLAACPTRKLLDEIAGEVGQPRPGGAR